LLHCLIIGSDCVLPKCSKGRTRHEVVAESR
jgi:hypothetical protein